MKKYSESKKLKISKSDFGNSNIYMRGKMFSEILNHPTSMNPIIDSS
jgi:hypothetical protein